MYWGQGNLLSISITTDPTGHNQATSTGIENLRPISSGNFLKYFILTHIKPGVQITTYLDISPVSKGRFP